MEPKGLLEISYHVQFVKPCLLAGIIEVVNLQEARKTYRKMAPLLHHVLNGAEMVYVERMSSDEGA